MNGFSFLSNTAKTLSLSADCSAGTLPDLIKAIFGQKLFGKIADLHLQAQVGGSGGKRGGERSPYKVSTLPAARGGEPAFLIKWCKRHGLCPSRSGSEHLSLLPGFCICSLRHLGSVHPTLPVQTPCKPFFRQPSPEAPYSHWEWPPKLTAFPSLLERSLFHRSVQNNHQSCVFYIDINC